MKNNLGTKVKRKNGKRERNKRGREKKEELRIQELIEF